MMKLLPFITFNNGTKIPRVGLGTWLSPPGKVTSAVKDAIDAGYRHIDCAFVYLNKNEVGEGIREKIADNVIKRDDLFVTSKLWNTFHRSDLVKETLLSQLKTLGLDYLNLYLIHWPVAFQEGGEPRPMDADGKYLISDSDWLDSWKEMEKLYDDGIVKAIGVCNFNKRQLSRLLENARIKPVTNQMECHPYFQQKKLSAFCKEHEIVVTAFSPLGSPLRPFSKPDEPVLLEEPLIQQIATKYNKEPAQVLIRYQMQRGHVVLAKSVIKARIISNINVWDFELTSEDIESIETLERNMRLISMVAYNGHPEYPFNDPY